jgi:hypothetical protein
VNERWFAVVGPEVALTQGDIIVDCPLLRWLTPAKEGASDTSARPAVEPIDRLTKLAAAIKADVVIMSQACDLEHGKVSDVVLCPCLSLSKYKRLWEAAEQARKQNPTPKAWKRFCEEITDGYLWNLFMMDAMSEGEITAEHRIVDFYFVYTIPRGFMDDLIAERGTKRLTLMSPYREHLSQSFARYFMRVGLPENVKPAW